MSEAQFRNSIDEEYPKYAVELVFPVLFHEWDCDGWAAIATKPGGPRVLITSNHGSLGIEKDAAAFLKERRKEYSDAAAKAMEASQLLIQLG